MAKRIPLTDAIKTQIKANTGADPVGDVAVFEAVSVTTLPINKPGSIFDKGRIQRDVLDAAANYVNGGGNVPLHVMHDQSYELPVGRTFHAEVVPMGVGGEYELRSLFFIDPSEEKLISKVENSTISEVSVGLKTSKMLCSGCDFDYMKDSGARWDRICANGHALGMGDFHLKLSGFDRFYEQSLVSVGASVGNKIVGDRQRLLAAQLDGAAGSEHNHYQILLYAQPTLGQIQLSEAEMKELDEVNLKLKTLSDKVETLEQARTKEVAELKTQHETQLTELKQAHETQITELKTEHEKTTNELKAQVTTALGEGDTAIGKVVEGLQASVNELQKTPAVPAHLAYKIQMNSVPNAKSSVTDADASDDESRALERKTQAFKLTK